MAASSVALGTIRFANDAPFVLIGGVNVLESREFALEVAGHYKTVCAELGIPLVFKASYDKANRSSIHSYRGPGLKEGLAILQAAPRSWRGSLPLRPPSCRGRSRPRRRPRRQQFWRPRG